MRTRPLQALRELREGGAGSPYPQLQVHWQAAEPLGLNQNVLVRAGIERLTHFHVQLEVRGTQNVQGHSWLTQGPNCFKLHLFDPPLKARTFHSQDTYNRI